MASKREQVEPGTPEAELQRRKKLAGWQIGLLIVSVLVMFAGVALGVTGMLADEEVAAQQQARQQEAARDGSQGGSQAPASGFVGGDGGVTWPFPVPGAPGGTPAPEGAPGEPGEGAQAERVEQAPADPWSPAIFRMGFGFFVGFSMAYAFRAFAKFAVVSLGVFFLLLFGLQYAGLIEVQWGAMAERYDSARGWLGAQFDGFTAFVTGALPSAGAALAGLGLGFIRK
ncbi:MAG: FUN14 domain-containing protein [Phycisphaerales bacterium JB060]